MIPLTSGSFQVIAGFVAGLAFVLLIAGLKGRSGGLPLEYWHTEKLSEEFTADMTQDDVRSFNDYLQLEQRLFRQLDEKVYANTGTGPDQALNRYSPGSFADPRKRQPDWNRSFEWDGAGAGSVLLLHGMSDSPYSLRVLGESLNRRGYHVIGLRLPGHGTAPSGLKYVSWQDMAAAVSLAMKRLSDGLDSESGPVHIIGYSTGASLALDFTLNALAGNSAPVPASLALISPAIRIHRSAKLAGFKNGLSVIPGLGQLAWLSVMDEFDPYKFNSFATNAGAQVHQVTVDVDRRMQALAREDPAAIDGFPPVLVFKSTVDFTVTNDAVVDSLLSRLPADRNELVLFDINRHAAVQATLLVADPAPFTNRLLAENDLPFAVTFITNESPESVRVVARQKVPHAAEVSLAYPLDFAWPRGVVSLSHVALPIPPDDPLYGQFAPLEDDAVFLGDLALRGERGLLKIPEDWLLRMRYNPFYGYLEDRVLGWVDDAGGRN
jgi:alpha-beta hydrolase superfamily lysophospholipase